MGFISSGYLRVKINGINKLAHRVIFLLCNKYLPDTIDHIDQNPLNNSIENLRECTKGQNKANSKPTKNSIVKSKGVDIHNNLFRVRVKQKHVGYFRTEKEAAEAYNNIAIKEFKDFASLNQKETI